MKESYKTYHNVHEWTVDDVKKWLKEKKFDNYMCNLFHQHKIDGKTLLTLREDDLRKPPLQLNILGDIKKMYLLINQLQTINVKFYSQISNNPFLDINNVNYVQLKEQIKDDLKKDNNISSNRKKYQLNDDQETDFSTVPDEISEINENDDFKLLKLPNGKYQEFKPEAWKALIAMIYFFIVTWITAIVMVIVHDRVPDMQTYPPLPDIFLDNVPLIPWAFAMCELCCLILFMILCTVLLFHKHRFIVIRRIFSLFGTVFLLRCFTMLITSLSVPGRHLQCKARSYSQWVDRLKEAYLIWQGVGMSIQGVRTCGDYMFSGHAVTLTLLNFFITEYTPRNFYPVHTLSWVLNLFGFFFILAGHEHYSIDVFIAFYISNRIFLYYHTLANNRALYQGDRRRTRIWFPLFYLFESGVNGIIPNIFELPFKNIITKIKNIENSEKINIFSNMNGTTNKKDFQKLKENDLNESNYSSSKSSRGSKRKNKKKN